MDELIHIAPGERERDLETEKLIAGKNRHSVLRWCAAHGFGVHMPGEDLCPNCGEHCILYLSGEDVRVVVADLTTEAERLRAALAPLLDEFGARLSDGKPLGYTIGSMDRALKMVRAASDALAG